MASATILRVQEILDNVYGPYTGPDWRPRPFKKGVRNGRYLWSDAFGVVNFLSLHYATGGQPGTPSQWVKQAAILIEDVHNTLGRDRHTGKRLPPATDAEPLLGGLRIGKAEEERDARGRVNPDGDGQYFHYLTKWMFALNRMAQATGDSSYNAHAVTLARVAHAAFVYGNAPAAPCPTAAAAAAAGPSVNRPRMYWKMSVDLRTPLVTSEGNLDPFDGLVMFRRLAADASPAVSIKNVDVAAGSSRMAAPAGPLPGPLASTRVGSPGGASGGNREEEGGTRGDVPGQGEGASHTKVGVERGGGGRVSQGAQGERASGQQQQQEQEEEKQKLQKQSGQQQHPEGNQQQQHRKQPQQGKQGLPLSRQIADLSAMVQGKYGAFDSSDALDLGESLWLCSWADPQEAWVQHVQHTALSRIRDLFKLDFFGSGSPRSRLLFREMGLTLGLQCSVGVEVSLHEDDTDWGHRVRALHEFWADHLYRRDVDISPLMYAASILPGVWMPRRARSVVAAYTALIATSSDSNTCSTAFKICLLDMQHCFQHVYTWTAQQIPTDYTNVLNSCMGSWLPSTKDDIDTRIALSCPHIAKAFGLKGALSAGGTNDRTRIYKNQWSPRWYVNTADCCCVRMLQRRSPTEPTPNFFQKLELPDSGISRIAAWSIVAVFTFGLVYPRGDSLLPAPAWKHFDKVQHAGGYALCVAALAIAHMTWFGLTSAPPFRFLPGHAIGPSQPGSAHRRAGPWSEPDASSSESGHKWGLRYPRLRKLAMAAMAHALTTELVQALTPRRSASAEAARALVKEKFLEEDFEAVLKGCLRLADHVIEELCPEDDARVAKLAYAIRYYVRAHRDAEAACGPETLLAALSAPLYRDLTEEERLHAHVFADFVDSKRVNKGPTLSASTERVFDAFSDFLEDRNFPKYDHFSRFREDKWYWNALFDRYGFSTGGGLGSKRTSGFSVNGSRDPKDACTESVSLEDPDPDRCDFRVFCGKPRLSLVTNALMKYAGDLVSDEVLNEIIDAFDRTGVNNLTTEERYRTSHLHGLVTAMAENGVSVPEAVRDWIVDHRAALSEKIYSHNAQFQRSSRRQAKE
eukprot:jgi/Mesvir1/23408/Mv21100-RA.1